jgi:hypothetical protein
LFDAVSAAAIFKQDDAAMNEIYRCYFAGEFSDVTRSCERVTGSQPISGSISLPNEDLTLVTPPT